MKMAAKWLALATVISILSAAYFPAMPCTCEGEKPSPCEAVRAKELVFIGTVLEIINTPLFIGPRFRIDRIVKGNLGKTVDLFDGGMCEGPIFEIGTQYLIYTSHFGAHPDARYCGNRSRRIEEADEDLDFLKWYGEENRLGFLSGTIRLLPDDWVDTVLEQFSYSNGLLNGTQYDLIKNASVRIKTEDRDFSITTNDKGRFSIGNLPSGIYHIQVSGYSIRMEPDTIFVPENGCSEANVFVKTAH
jgi:hypothetical protein